MGKDCKVMNRHRLRVRERNCNQDEQNEETYENNDTLTEIIGAVLSSAHCHFLHRDKHLFRIERAKEIGQDETLHFISSQNDNEEKKEDEFIKLKFGQSVLEWLRFDEQPTFSSLHEEIINNPSSTISGPLFFEFVQECYIKAINNNLAMIS